VALSAISLLEIAVLASGEKPGLKVSLDEFFQNLNSNPAFRILPLTYEVALDVASLSVLRDPPTAQIAATARVHRLRLVTSDRRIIESKLVQWSNSQFNSVTGNEIPKLRGFRSQPPNWRAIRTAELRWGPGARL